MMIVESGKAHHGGLFCAISPKNSATSAGREIHRQPVLRPGKQEAILEPYLANAHATRLCPSLTFLRNSFIIPKLLSDAASKTDAAKAESGRSMAILSMPEALKSPAAGVVYIGK